MKKLTRLNGILSMRTYLSKQWERYTESEVNVLICIYVMNEGAEYCSSKTLFDRLSQLHRMPHKKKFLASLRKFKQQEVIRVVKKGTIARIELRLKGYLFLSRFDNEIDKV